MFRARVLTSLAFNLVIALWVLHDARARRARKPAFAAALGLLWGPLGLGFWESDRPLRAGEIRQGGTAWQVAVGFLRGWIALLPAIIVLAAPVVANRAAVPGSLGREAGLVPATVIVLAAFWGGPALVALMLGALGRRRVAELGSSATPGASVSASVAAGLAGAAAAATALALIARGS
jgi:hypothetical protein